MSQFFSLGGQSIGVAWRFNFHKFFLKYNCLHLNSCCNWASLEAQMVKNLPAIQETRVRSLALGRSPGGGHGNPLQSMGLKRVGQEWATEHKYILPSVSVGDRRNWFQDPLQIPKSTDAHVLHMKYWFTVGWIHGWLTKMWTYRYRGSTVSQLYYFYSQQYYT